MSERATRATQDILLEALPEAFRGSSTERWQAVQSLRTKADELVAADLLDDEAVREISVTNAEYFGLDHEAADRVFDIRQKPAGGSLAAMHAPSRLVWRGTGGSMAAVGPKVVHYVDRPGAVEAIYGPGFPYIIDKLAWLAIAQDIAGHAALENGGGYQYVTNRLFRFGRTGLPHIGPAIVTRAEVCSPRPATPDRLIVSASGTLPEGWVDDTYQRIPAYADRAIVDEANGLFDGHIENRRAGLYDVAFAEMVGRLLYGERLDDRMLETFSPTPYEGVDIN